MYRVKEYNNIYNPYFKDGVGWIFVSNELPLFKAYCYMVFVYFSRNNGLKYEIVDVTPKLLTY